MRLGVFGGTFDPPHVGHLLVASDAAEALALDRLLFIPARVQPFKAERALAPAADRLRMVQLMVEGDPRFAVDPVEIEREGLSFTVDTLATLAARDPAAQRFLLVGEDVAPQLQSWREPARIAALAEIVVLVRAGASPADAATAAELPMRRLSTRVIDVSSTEIRARRRAGRSIRGFVTDAVAAFIEAAGLYR